MRHQGSWRTNRDLFRSSNVSFTHMAFQERLKRLEELVATLGKEGGIAIEMAPLANTVRFSC